MCETNSSQQCPGAGAAPGQNASPNAAPGGQHRCVFDPIVDAFRRGADDARNAAQDALPKIKSLATDAAANIAYGVSFAAVFQYSLLRELCPETIRESVHQGAAKGKASAETFAARFRKPAESNPEPAASPVPPPIQPAPGMA